MSAEPILHFAGHDDRECGEHRSLGSHRAWCHDCGEYCYPRIEGACRGCLEPHRVKTLKTAVDLISDVIRRLQRRASINQDPHLLDWIGNLEDARNHLREVGE